MRNNCNYNTFTGWTAAIVGAAGTSGAAAVQQQKDIDQW